MSTFEIGDGEVMRLLGHPDMARDPLFGRALTLYAVARGRGRGCCGHPAGPAGATMWRSAAVAALHRHVAVHSGVAAAAARQVFGLAPDALVVVAMNGQSIAL